MARPVRIEFPGAVYHIFSRGNRQENIFLDDEDRNLFLKILSSTVSRLNWVCHAYCLMSNHYHLLIETPEGLLSKGMQYLNSNYSRKFNKKYGLRGHLFEKRYTAKLIDGNLQLLTTARYIVRNPLAANMVLDAAKWKWSSYRATVGIERIPDFLFIDDVLSCMSTDRYIAGKFFKDLVHSEDGPETELLLQQVYSQKEHRGLAGRIRPIIDMRQSLAPVARKQRILSRPTLEELFLGVGSYEREKRNEIIRLAFGSYGYSQTELGDFLGLCQASISRITNKKSF